MYVIRVSKGQVTFLYCISIAFFIFAVLGSGFIPTGSFTTGKSIGAAAIFIIFSLLTAAYALTVSQRRVLFDPNSPSITIKRLLRKPITLRPEDCILLTKSQGTTTSPKLIYRYNNRRSSIVLFSSDYKALRAWTRYSKRWLQHLKTKSVIQDDILEDQIGTSPSEDYFQKHFNNK